MCASIAEVRCCVLHSRLHGVVACLLLMGCCTRAFAYAIFPVCTLEYLVNHSTQIVIGTVTPGTAADAYTPAFDHVTLTQVFKGELKPGQKIEVQEVLSNFPSHYPHRLPEPLPFQVDSVLLFLVEQSEWTAMPRQAGQYFQIRGGGPCLFGSDHAYACFQTMHPQPLEASRKKQWPFGQINAVLNPPNLSKNQVMQQLDEALHPSAERLAITSGDPDDPALVRARCEFIKQRQALFHEIEFLEDDAVRQAADRIGKIKPFEQLDAMVTGPDIALGDAVPTDIYLVSDIGRRRLIEHFADPKLSDRRFDQLSLALAHGGVARGYLAFHELRPGDANPGTMPY